MNQIIKDLILRVKSERKIQVMFGLVIVAVLFLIFAPGKQTRVVGRSRLQSSQAPKETVNINAMAKDTYQDLIQTVRRTSEENQQSIRELGDKVKKINEQQQEYEKTSTAIFGKIIEKLNDANNPPTSSNVGGSAAVEQYAPLENTATSVGDEGASATNVSVNLGQLEQIPTEGSQAIAPKAPVGPRRVAVVTAGDSVRVKLLAGVHAPTDGTPYPVVFKLTGNVSGPNDSTLPLGEARLVAAAQGSLTDQRALFRLTKLSIAYPNGRRREIEVDGWVVGEDGMRGMEGRLLDPIGRALGAGIMVGTIEGLGDAMESKNVTQNTNIVGGSEMYVSGDEMEYALGNGISKGAQRYGRILDDRVKRLVPHVEVLSGREATAIFAKAFTIPDLMEELDAEESSSASLD